MSAIYMSQLSTALPLMEGDHHQDHHHHHHQGHFQAFTTLPKDPPILFPFVISSSSASDSSGLSYGSADGNHLLRQHHQAMLEPQHMFSGSSAASAFMTPFPTVESIRDDMIEPSSYDPYDMAAGKLQVGGPALETAAGSWTPPPAKMRITRKATAADPGAAKKPRRRAAQGCEEDMMGMGGGQPNLGVIRVCSDCNTTKTPLWRSGPCGPKSLCNACGIRQRKARRAMMASSWGSGPVPTDGGKAAATATTPRDAMGAAAAAHPKVKKEKSRVDADRSLPFKKRCKAVVQDHAAVAAPAATAFKPATDAEAVDDDAGGLSRDLKLVDNIGLISWSRTSPAPASGAASCSLFRASPGLPVQHQDEITDAAMLLMTLSCGLVRS